MLRRTICDGAGLGQGGSAIAVRSNLYYGQSRGAVLHCERSDAWPGARVGRRMSRDGYRRIYAPSCSTLVPAVRSAPAHPVILQTVPRYPEAAAARNFTHYSWTWCVFEVGTCKWSRADSGLRSGVVRCAATEPHDRCELWFLILQVVLKSCVYPITAVHSDSYCTPIAIRSPPYMSKPFGSYRTSGHKVAIQQVSVIACRIAIEFLIDGLIKT